MVYFIYQNLPLNITANSSTTTYSYNGNGERITKNNEYYLRDYAGRELAIYNNTADTLKSVNLFGNGMIGIYLSGEDKSMYFAKDHLGTVRTTMNETGEVENATDYYPYGEEITGRSINYGQLAKYKFTGKELDTESGRYYFGARTYNKELGIWDQVDPMGDYFASWSSYNYCYDNPNIYIDMWGFAPDSLKNSDYLRGKTFPDIVVTANREYDPLVSQLIPIQGPYGLGSIESTNNNGYSSLPYIGFGWQYLEHRVERAKNLTVDRKIYKKTKAKAAAKFDKYLKPIKVISTGLVALDFATSIYEGIETGDYSQMFIDWGIIGISAASGPLGLGLTVLDQTVGIKNMLNTNVKMEIERARRGLPSPMSHLP